MQKAIMNVEGIITRKSLRSWWSGKSKWSRSPRKTSDAYRSWKTRCSSGSSCSRSSRETGCAWMQTQL